jgi:hypothetical protein
VRRDLGRHEQGEPGSRPRYPVPRFFAFRSDQAMRRLLTGQFDILSLAVLENADSNRFQSFMLQKTATWARNGETPWPLSETVRVAGGRGVS